MQRDFFESVAAYCAGFAALVSCCALPDTIRRLACDDTSDCSADFEPLRVAQFRTATGIREPLAANADPPRVVPLPSRVTGT